MPGSDYTYGIAESPSLTTDDSGSTVTINSRLNVNRATDKWPGETVESDLPVSWSPGARVPEHAMDESWGTHPRRFVP